MAALRGRCGHYIFALWFLSSSSSSFSSPWVSRLLSVTARHSSSGRQPNSAAFNRGRHLYSAGRPSRWALAHILLHVVFHIGSLYVVWPIQRTQFVSSIIGLADHDRGRYRQRRWPVEYFRQGPSF